MSVGDGIFLSAIFLGLIALFIASRCCWGRAAPVLALFSNGPRYSSRFCQNERFFFWYWYVV